MSAIATVDAATLLAGMVDIPSVSGDELRLATWLVERLDEAGFATSIDAAGNLIASWGAGTEHTALVGHIDTAPGSIPMLIDGDLLYGRGAVDAKGPLLTAILAVMRQPRDGRRRFTVIGAVEEETTSRGAHHLAATFPAPEDLVILEPSGWDGITVGYKGSLRVRWTRHQPSGHGAGPSISAADHAIAFMQRLREHADAWSGDAGIFDRLDVRVIRCDAGSDGMVDSAHLDVGMRIPPHYDADALVRVVRHLANGGELAVENLDAPVRTPRTSALARRFARAIRHQAGTPRFKLKTGTSDLNVLVPAWGCPAVAYGPGDSRLDHTPEEHLSIGELERAVDVLDVALRAA